MKKTPPKTKAPRSRTALYDFVQERRKKLANVDFSGAELAAADFSNADLAGAVFCDANLVGADFGSANLEGADFTRAEISRASFFDASAVGVDCREVTAFATDFSHADFSRACFRSADLERSNFTETTLTDAEFGESLLTHSLFLSSTLAGASFDAELAGTVFANVDLGGVRGLENAAAEAEVFLDLRTYELLMEKRPAGFEQLVAVSREAPASPLPRFARPTSVGAELSQRAPWDVMVEYLVEARVTPGLADKLAAAVESATCEEDVQAFIRDSPETLLCLVAAHHRGWVIPKAKLGAEHVTDFLVAGRTSRGMEWLAVELESPKAKLFTLKGEESAQLQHAIGQIADWREWLAGNSAYAERRPPNGLGFVGIRAALPGLVIMGRQTALPQSVVGGERQRARRFAISTERHIEVRTFDGLIDAVRKAER